MPITLTLTEGVLPVEKAKQAAVQLSTSLLEHHGLSGNTVMTPNVTAVVNIIPKGLTFSGGKEVEGAWIELKTPSFALADDKTQAGFFSDAIQIVHDLSDGKLPKASIWTNGMHAVDGAWSINGVRMTNAEVIEAVTKG